MITPGAIKDRVAFEVWLIDHGIKPEHVAHVQRIVIRPHWHHALVVFPWDEDAGQLVVQVDLKKDEVARYHGGSYDVKWQAVLPYKCQYCGAHAGDWCVTNGGWPLPRTSTPHGARLAVAGESLAAPGGVEDNAADLWVKAMRYACPNCGAKVAQWCTTASGDEVLTSNGPHSARIKLIRADA